MLFFHDDSRSFCCWMARKNSRNATWTAVQKLNGTWKIELSFSDTDGMCENLHWFDSNDCNVYWEHDRDRNSEWWSNLRHYECLQPNIVEHIFRFADRRIRCEGRNERVHGDGCFFCRKETHRKLENHLTNCAVVNLLNRTSGKKIFKTAEFG